MFLEHAFGDFKRCSRQIYKVKEKKKKKPSTLVTLLVPVFMNF